MAATFMDTGVADFMQLLFGGTSAGGFQLCLYTNDYTPTPSDVIGDYTECALSGYGRAYLDISGATFSVVSDVALAAFAAQVFTFSAYGGGTTIYGYFLVDNDNSDLICAELLGTPYAVPNGGGSLSLTPTFSLQQA